MSHTAILFDLDGTLLDTLDDLTDSVNFILERYGFPARTSAEIRSFVGNGAVQLIERALPAPLAGEQFEEILHEYQAHYHAHSQHKTKPYPGILDTVRELDRRGLKLGVVSNKPDAAAKHLCDQFFGGMFSVVLGETPGIRRKPAPDMIWAALDQMNVTKQDTLYVGDSEVDVETAKQAGVQCVAVTWGFRDADVLRAAGADLLIDQQRELLEVVDGS